MDLDATIARLKELISQREAIDAELEAIFSGQSPKRRTLTCGICKQEGHNSRNCPQKPPDAAM